MVTDILEIRHLLQKNKLQNLAFAQFFNKFGVDMTYSAAQLLHGLSIKYSQLIDCTACGNCCTSITIHLFGEDRRRLAKALSMSEKDFIDLYMKKNDTGYLFAEKQCPFLENKRCLVYDHRPHVCRAFPLLDIVDLGMDGKTLIRIEELISLANRCPIIFNVLEDLKIQSGFTGKPDEPAKEARNTLQGEKSGKTNSLHEEIGALTPG